jgi:glycogen phosphorylase
MFRHVCLFALHGSCFIRICYFVDGGEPVIGQIAYFSAEFGLDETLPIYSGGLGVLAGDFVKAASDLEVPLIGVGILYRKGYFKQKILEDGTQEAVYSLMNPNELPIDPVLDATGKPVLVPVPIASRIVYLRVWRAHGGNVPVYLLDADIDVNSEADRRLTDRLYGGDKETRIIHEIILGIGGVRALRALQMEPEVWHLNEGHVAFAALERIREYSAQGIPFHTALEVVKSSTVFTTHTPVPAGHDVFSFDLVDRYLCDFYWQLGADREKIIELGRTEKGFNMTRLSVSVSSIVNGVSRLHAEVTKQLFHDWTPKIPASNVPVLGITNGVHTRTWLAPEISMLFHQYFESDWDSRISEKEMWTALYDIPDDSLWQAHLAAKRRMIAALDLPIPESACVVGFARRFATYKRATLILQDLERFSRIVTHKEHPVYFVFAGKAHPSDFGGQELVSRIVQMTKSDPFRGKVFFIPNYDLGIAKQLVQGVDIWLNTPIRPMEASGTSGQKAALNGILNCSVLDGWWDEGYNGKNGFAIRNEETNISDRDKIDAESLYTLLEQEIVPLYYRQTHGVSHEWLQMMKHSMASLIPEFSTSRMMQEYVRCVYEPTEKRGGRFRENRFEVAKRVADYKQFIRANWPVVRVHSIRVTSFSSESSRTGELEANIEIYLGPIWYRDVEVDIFSSDRNGAVYEQKIDHFDEIRPGFHLFSGRFRNSGESKLNVRILPVSPDFSNRFEMELTTWG